MHRCSTCATEFDSRAHKIVPSWIGSLSRDDQSMKASRSDLEDFGKVKCPNCGHVEDADELRAFGFLTRTHLKLIIAAMLLAFIIHSAYFVWSQTR